jgi:transcriptional regulator with XRE-family HTH domain
MESEEEFTDLAAAIAGARKKAGLTQREAADRIGMSHRSWQDWERGEGDAVSNIPKIETALELPRGWFAEQLTVLQRVAGLEGRLASIEAKLDELLARQAGLEYAIRTLLH